jgi:glycosyltransferase involved in cell wall biosynthesis
MIAFFSIAPFLSGSERCLQLMLLESKNDGLQPVLVTSPNSPLQKWAKDNRIDHFSVELNPTKVTSKARWLAEQIRLTIFLKRKNVKVIHSNQIWSYRAALLPAKLLRAKVVCHFRDPIDSGSRWWLPRKPDLCIFISDYIQKQYASTFQIASDQNVVKMIDPIKRPRRQSSSEQEKKKKIARELFNLGADTLVFGFIGQIAPVKGLLETIKILSELKRDDWMLVVAGEDPSSDHGYFEECVREVNDRGLSKKIIFIGFQEKISVVYEAIDLIVMLSKEEPLGLIPLEAGGFYRPSIVSKVGGLPETVSNGGSGWIIDPDNHEEAIAIIESISPEDLRKKALNARHFTESIDDPKKYWKALASVYSHSGIELH